MAATHSAIRQTVSFERERGVYDVQHQRELAHVVVHVAAGEHRAEQFLQVFRILAGEAIPIFLIKLHRGALTFATSGQDLDRVEQCVRAAGFDCKLRRGLVLVTVVASSMRDLTGVMVDVADAIQRAGARLYGVGDSHNTVQCLIEGARADLAIAELKRAFGLQGRQGGPDG